MVKNWLSLTLVTTLLAGVAAPALAAAPAQQVPPEIQQYAQPGETVTTLKPVVIGNQQYPIFYFHTGQEADQVGGIFYNNLPARWPVRGIQGVLVTNDRYRPIRDEDLLRHVFLTEMAGYMTTQLTDVPDIVWVDQGLVDMMYSLTENPIYQTAFGLQEVQSFFASLLQDESQQYTEAFRAILTAPSQDSVLVNEFTAEVRARLEAGTDLGNALDDAILLAKFSNSRRVRQVARDARRLFDDWKTDTSLGTVDIRVGSSRFNLAFGNALDLASLAVELIFLQDLSLKRAERLEALAEYARQQGLPVSPVVLTAVDTVVAEARDATRHRFDLFREFLVDEAGQLAVELGRQALVKMWKDWAWQEFGRRTVGHLVAAAAAQVLLAYSLSSLLFGFDSIYENTIIAQRAAELRTEFDNVATWAREQADPHVVSYDATLCDVYRTAFLFKNLSASQLSRSYADMIAGSRLLKEVGDLITGNQWTEAERLFREDANQGALQAEEAALRPPIIDYAIELALARAAMAPEEVSLSSATVLVVDVSGSMGDDWQGGVKIESAKAAAIDVINMIEQENQIGASNHQVAIVTFTTDAYLDLEMTTDYSAARQVINGLIPLDGTNIGAGLQIANQALDSAPDGTQKIIILLSDGITNEGLSPQEILDDPVQEAASAGTCIYTIGFGDPGDLDEELLRNIAAGAACGEYNYASAPDELERVYIRLRHQSLGQILGEFHGQVAQGEQVDAGQVDVPSGQGGLYASLYWPGSVLGLVLTDPQGQVVDDNYPGTTISSYPKLVYVIVDDPLAGMWNVDVYGQDVPAGTTWFDVIVSSRVASTASVPSPGGIGPALVFLLVVVGAVALLVLSATRGRMRTTTAGVPGVARPRLIVYSGRLTGREFPLSVQGLTIGRGRDNDVQLEGSTVSRRHAAIRPARGQFFLQDQGGTTGTFVNGQRVNATALKDGDRIRIGSTEFEFRIG